MKSDEYLSLKGRSEGLYKVKGSKHFSYAFPIASEVEVKGLLEQIRIEHHSARHHCYAWRLGYDSSKFRSNDDGEPNNSAGPPILGVLKSHNLTNSLIIVVRYFGGTKLGVGGLMEAYREASQLAIADGTIVKCYRSIRFALRYPYSKMGGVMNVLKRANLSPENTDFQLTCKLEVTIRLSNAEELEKKLLDIDEVEISIISEC